MNNFKKFASLLMALMLLLTMAAPAMAATVDNNTSHTYKAYQIFKGTQATAGGTLGDVEWGDGIDSTKFLTALKDDNRFKVEGVNIFADCNTAAAVAEKLAANTSVANAFAEVAAANKTGDGTDVLADAQNIDLDIGYYVVIDQTDVSGKNDAKNPALLQVINNGEFQIQDKYEVPTVDKEIVNEEDAADANIGDVITFTLTATMPSNLTGYDTYKLVFNDTMSKGLTFKEIISVKIGERVLDAPQYTVEHGTASDTEGKYVGGSTLTVTINDVMALGATAGTKVVVTYTATVNAEAKIGSSGNPNKVDLEYSNDPSNEGDGTGKTPEDEVSVFTYELDVTKTDNKTENAIKLKDAEFVLYRMNDEKKEYVQIDANGKVIGWTDTKPETGNLKSDANGLFKVIGLDAGIYWLEETKAPAGYNLLTAPIKIEIVAAITDTEDNQSLNDLKIKVDDEEANGSKDTGIVGTTVINNPGSTLPETGGMGTTLFYALGSLLVVGAVVVLISKKRAASK